MCNHSILLTATLFIYMHGKADFVQVHEKHAQTMCIFAVDVRSRLNQIISIQNINNRKEIDKKKIFYVDLN